jgi:hypothetical protein
MTNLGLWFFLRETIQNSLYGDVKGSLTYWKKGFKNELLCIEILKTKTLFNLKSITKDIIKNQLVNISRET